MSAEDDSRRWQKKQAHYQDPQVVASYDAARFESLRSRGDTARMLAAARRLLGPQWERAHTAIFAGTVFSVPRAAARELMDAFLDTLQWLLTRGVAASWWVTLASSVYT